MIVRVSELMKNYLDDEYDLPDREHPDPEKIKSMTAAKVAALRKSAPDSTRGKTRRHALRIVLLAAAFAALLSVTAYAVYQRSMADRVLAGGVTETARDGSAIVQYSAVGGGAEVSASMGPARTDDPAPTGAEQYATYSDEDGTYYSSMGKNNEYEAQKEWTAFCFGDVPLDARDALDYSDPYRLIYGAAYGVLAEKLDAIAEKYGLRLMRSMATVDTEQEFLDALALDSFYPAAEDADGRHTFNVYDDGSFEASGLEMLLPEGGTLGFNVYRAVRGTLTDFYVLGGDPALAEFETYTAASGTEVDIALEDDDALLFADMENCHMTFEFYAGRETGMTMARLEAVADSIGFAALDEINVPAVAENVAAGMEQNTQDNPGSYREVTGKVQRIYDEMGDYSLEGLLPEGWQFTVSYANAAEDMAERLEGLGKEPGPADYYDNININYYHPEISASYASEKWVTLTYERYWGDPDRAVIRNAQAFHDRRTTSISGPGYVWETELISCTVDGFDGYYAVSNHFGSRVDSQGTYLTWYDRSKQLLFTLSAPMPEFSTEDTLALAEDFAASIQDVQGPAPTGTVSDEVEEQPPAD